MEATQSTHYQMVGATVWMHEPNSAKLSREVCKLSASST
jgi:hypothetical protein